MARDFQISESRDRIVATIHNAHPAWKVLLTAPIAGALTAWVASDRLPGRWWIILALIAFVVSLVASARTRRAELRVTKVEFATRGNVNMKFRIGQAVPTAEVRSLEFRDEVGSEGQAEPQGLYAVTNGGYACLLPFVTELETMQLIREIEKKFPAIAELWRSGSAFDANFLTLGIGRTK